MTHSVPTRLSSDLLHLLPQAPHLMRGLRHWLQFGIFLRQADELLGRKIGSGHIGLNFIPPCPYGANPVGGYLHQFRPSLWATASMAIISCSPLCRFFTAASPRANIGRASCRESVCP